MRTRSSDKKVDSLDDPTFHDQKRLVLPGLGDVISLEDDTFTRSLYHHIASESAIDAFLKKSRLYSLAQRRWKLPRRCTKLLDNDLCGPFKKVFSSILDHFLDRSSAQETREIVDTHATDLLHREADALTHCSHPSLVIKAEGPSFQVPHTIQGNPSTSVGFSNITSCIEIYMQGNEPPIAEQLVQMAIYAR